MITGRAAAAGAFVTILCWLTFVVEASANDLNGAWANNESVCSKIFVKRGNKVAVSSGADSYGSGFVIEGASIKGKIITCSIKSRREDGGILHLHTVCSTDVALQNVQFSVKWENGNTMTRIFPGIPDLNTVYYRCSL